MMGLTWPAASVENTGFDNLQPTPNFGHMNISIIMRQINGLSAGRELLNPPLWAEVVGALRSGFRSTAVSSPAYCVYTVHAPRQRFRPLHHDAHHSDTEANQRAVGGRNRSVNAQSLSKTHVFASQQPWDSEYHVSTSESGFIEVGCEPPISIRR